MTIGWVVYAWVAAALLGLAAALVEQALRAVGRQARGVWVVAAVAAVALGMAGWPTEGSTSGTSGRSTAGASVLSGHESVSTGPSIATAASQSDLSEADRGQSAGSEWMPLALQTLSADLLRRRVPGGAIMWFGGSLILFGFWLVQAVRLRRMRRHWPEVQVDGVPVLVSGDMGPAAMGFFRGRVVLPRWAMAGLPSDSIRLAVCHEEEHVRARDVPLLATMGLLVAAMPWNLPLWAYARRLRVAVELDCDLRVVRRGVDRSAYGHLLVAIAAAARPLPIRVPGLGGRSHLTERIERLTSVPDQPRWKAALLVFPAVLVGLLACEVPSPTAPLGQEFQLSEGAVLMELLLSELRPLMDVSGALGGEPWVTESDAMVALLLELGPDGRATRVEVQATTGPHLPAGALDAVIRELARPAFKAESEIIPGGLTPVWLLLAQNRVEIHVVDLEMYKEHDLGRDRAALVRQMEGYREMAGHYDAPKISHALAVAQVGGRPMGANGGKGGRVRVFSNEEGDASVMAGEMPGEIDLAAALGVGSRRR